MIIDLRAWYAEGSKKQASSMKFDAALSVQELGKLNYRGRSGWPVSTTELRYYLLSIDGKRTPTIR